MGREATKVVDWSKPQAVSVLEVAFPARVIGTLLPPMSEIPSEFKNYYNDWCGVVSKLFFEGGELPKVKDGIDAAAANGHLQAVLGSFEPQHQHKTYGAAYLISLWYQEPKEWATKNKKK
jgi:hypothetical protein